MLSGCQPCGSWCGSAAGTFPVQQEDFGWALPEWERGVHIPVLPCPAREGWVDGWIVHCIIHSALASPQVQSVSVSTAQLLLHAGQELHCQHVSRGQSSPFLLSFFLFFPVFLAHFTGLEFDLQTLSRSQVFLLKRGAYRSSTQRINEDKLYMPNLTILLKYTVADLCLHNLSKMGTKMPDSCDSKPFQAPMVPSLTPCFPVSCSAPRGQPVPLEFHW